MAKVGGAELPSVGRLWPELRSLDRPFVLVHGGGGAVTAAAGSAATFVGGRRVSDARTAAAAAETLWRLGEDLVEAGRRQGLPQAPVKGGQAEGLPLVPLDPGRLGRVGRPAALEAGPLTAALARGEPAVVSPPGLGPDGEWLNVNADDMAAFLAGVLAAPLLLFTDVPGVLAGGQVLRRLSPSACARLIASGEAGGGMAAKLEAAVAALQSGAPFVWIGPIDGPRPLANALAAHVGTVIQQGGIPC